MPARSFALILAIGVPAVMSVPFSSVNAATANVSIAYTYDVDGRVKTVGYVDANSGAIACIVYTYDTDGNRLTQTNSATAEPACANSGMTPSAAFAQTSRPGGASSAPPQSGAGNLAGR